MTQPPKIWSRMRYAYRDGYRESKGGWGAHRYLVQEDIYTVEADNILVHFAGRGSDRSDADTWMRAFECWKVAERAYEDGATIHTLGELKTYEDNQNYVLSGSWSRIVTCLVIYRGKEVGAYDGSMNFLEEF